MSEDVLPICFVVQCAKQSCYSQFYAILNVTRIAVNIYINCSLFSHIQYYSNVHKHEYCQDFVAVVDNLIVVI